jgi:hypothetical protein
MSTTWFEGRSVFPAVPREGDEGCSKPTDRDATDKEPGLLEMLSLSGWRWLALETLGLLAAIAALKHWFFADAELTSMPHPYWLVVLLASAQYGVTGGMIATVAAAVAYLFELSPPSAVQDFYGYAGMVAVQPTAWLATALVLGGLRSLQIYQTAELDRHLAACRRRANDLADGLERAAAEIDGLERRIATDMSSVAALSRGLSKIDLSDRCAAAESFGELFRAGTGTTTFTIYLKNPDGYVPVLAVEDDVSRPVKSLELLCPTTIDAMIEESACRAAAAQVAKGEPVAGRHVILVPPSESSTATLAAIVCRTLVAPQDARGFGQRTDDLSRAFATILSACPDPPRRSAG